MAWVERLCKQQHLEGPQCSSDGNESGSRKPDEAFCQAIGAGVMRQACIELGGRQSGSRAGSKHGRKTCAG